MTNDSGSIPMLDISLDRLSAVGMLKIVEDSARHAGDLVMLRFPRGEKLLVLGGIEHVRFWRDHEDLFHKAVDVLPSSSAVGRLVLGETLNTAPDGADWLRLRRLTVPIVRHTVDPLHKTIAQATDWLVAEIAHGTPVVSLQDICLRWSLKTICAPLFGNTVPEDDVFTFLAQLRTVFFDMISKAESDNVDQLRREPAVIALRASIEAFVEAALSQPCPSHECMIHDLYRQIAVDTTPERARCVLRSVVLGTLAGSVDNVGAALLWILVHLARTPETTARIAREADQTRFDSCQHTNTPIAFAAVRETFRLTPVSPLIERSTTTEIDLLGHRVDAGVNVLFSPWLVQRNARYWTDPLTFDIERFRPGTKIDLDRYFPFGIGKRQCVGMSLAQHQLTMAVSRVCQEVYFSLSGDCKPGHLKPVFRLLLWPRGPILINVDRRC